MKLKEQLHRSQTHAVGVDFRCPKCIEDNSAADVLAEVIKDLERCAEQNEKDAKFSGSICSRDFVQVTALAAEQRRMIAILKMVKKWTRALDMERTA